LSWAYVHTDRVRFGDLDPLGHLNNVDFLRFFESARIAFHRHLLDGEDWLQRADGFGIVVGELHASYRSPAFFEEELRTAVRPADLGRSSYRVEFQTRAADGRLVGEGHAVLVGYDRERKETLPIPDDVRAGLERAAAGPDAAGGGAWA
jgi:acyl-CoA thioester hydrolase